MKKLFHKCENLFIAILTHISVNLSSRYLFIRSQKKRLNLKNPKTFNEKLMWIKLNYYVNNPLVWKCVDKYEVRKYLLSCGVEEKHLPEIIGVYSSASEIDFSLLPKKYALKCSHGCGFNIICENNDSINHEKTKKQLNKWLKIKFGYSTAETQYIHQKPCIICEKYIDGNTGLPYDYKIYCFNGKPKCCLVCSNREKSLNLNYFDLDWNELYLGKEYLRNQKKIQKPKNLSKMIELAEKCSRNFPFVRVDFYENDSLPIIGELTFTPAACIANYYNESGQEYLAKFINIDEIKSNKKYMK